MTRVVDPEQLLRYRDRLAIVGSSTFHAPNGAQLAERKIRDLLAAARPNLVVSGRCPAGGVDDLAERVAAELDIPFLPRPASVHRWPGPGGFKERNLQIAADCTRLLRIVCAYTRTYGSGWTRDRAAERLPPACIRSYRVDEHGIHLEAARRPGSAIQGAPIVDGGGPGILTGPRVRRPGQDPSN